MAKPALINLDAVPVFELNAKYFASPDATVEQMNDDLGCMLSAVESSLSHLACELDTDEDGGFAGNPKATSSVLFALRYVTSFAHGISAQIADRLNGK